MMARSFSDNSGQRRGWVRSSARNRRLGSALEQAVEPAIAVLVISVVTIASLERTVTAVLARPE
jgi:hypothetical protein